MLEKIRVVLHGLARVGLGFLGKVSAWSIIAHLIYAGIRVFV